MKSWFRRHPKKILILINLLILLVGVIVFEMVLAARKSDEDQAAGLYRYIRLREHPPFERIIDSTLPKPSVLRSDAGGFIVPSFPHESPDLEIAFLGGSTTECIICQENKRFPFLTGRFLGEKTGLKINAINAGFRGSNSAHSINVLFNKVIPLQPDFAVLYHNINDLVTLAYMGTYWNEHFSRSLICELEEGWLRTIRLLMNNSLPNTFGLLREKGLFDIDAAIHQSQEDEWKGFRKGNSKAEPGAMRRMFTQNLTAFIHLCQSYGIVPVLMTQANDGKDPEEQINGLSLMKMHAEFNRLIREVCQREKVMLIDLAAELKDEDFFFDFIHFNNHGSYNASKVIVREFQTRLEKDKGK